MNLLSSRPEAEEDRCPASGTTSGETGGHVIQIHSNSYYNG